MERLNKYIVGWMACVMLLVFSNVVLPLQAKPDANADSVRISLLTCSPHPEVYSLYGHTAIRYENDATGADLVVNYGIFDFGGSWFVPKFTFGITDYSMGIVPFYHFKREYEAYGSSITQQELNLTAAEKSRLADALKENYLPQNRVYRYNYFYKNCSTMARDIIARCIDGSIRYPECTGKKSFRQMIHECNEGYPWARLGNDMLLGMKADFNTDTAERQFLPLILMEDFDRAVIVNGSGERPLVKSKCVVLQEGTKKEMEGFPLSPLACASILMALCLALTLYEDIRHAVTLWLDAVMMTATGIAGIIILLMFFSAHPTTSTNLLIIMLNPMPLFFIRRVYAARRNNRPCAWWKAWTAMGIMMLAAGAVLQDIDPSMFVIAAIIMIRALQHVRYEKKLKFKK